MPSILPPSNPPRLDGQRYALKSRIDTKDLDSNRSMHNELKMLQIIATSYHEGLPYLHDFFFDKSGDIEASILLLDFFALGCKIPYSS